MSVGGCFIPELVLKDERRILEKQPKRSSMVKEEDKERERENERIHENKILNLFVALLFIISLWINIV